MSGGVYTTKKGVSVSHTHRIHNESRPTISLLPRLLRNHLPHKVLPATLLLHLAQYPLHPLHQPLLLPRIRSSAPRPAYPALVVHQIGIPDLAVQQPNRLANLVRDPPPD